MKLIRYKNLSQNIDFENIYQNMIKLSELFMFTNDFFVFLRKKSNNETQMTKESFSGDFEILKIPFQTQGITVNQQQLYKFYYFSDIGLNLLSFKVSSEHFVTILENSNGEFAVFVDSTDNVKAMNFINSTCPLVTTSEDENYTIYSFNNLNDGTNSEALFNNMFDFSNYLDITYQSLDDKLTTITLSPLSFNLLIFGSTTRLLNYAMEDNTIATYIPNLSSLSKPIINQIKTDQTYEAITDNIISSYLSNYLDNSLVLTTFNNNSPIYLNTNNDKYIYKNIFKHIIDQTFYFSYIFNDNDVKYNLFKEILRVFNDNTNSKDYNISKVYITSNIFSSYESNLSENISTVYKEVTSYFNKCDGVVDNMLSNESNINSSLFYKNYRYEESKIINDNIIQLFSDNFTDTNLSNRYLGVLTNLYVTNQYVTNDQFNWNSIMVIESIDELSLDDYQIYISFEYYFNTYSENSDIAVYLTRSGVKNGLSKDAIEKLHFGECTISSFNDSYNVFFTDSTIYIPRSTGIQYSALITIRNKCQKLYINDILYSESSQEFNYNSKHISFNIHGESRIKSLSIFAYKL